MSADDHYLRLAMDVIARAGDIARAKQALNEEMLLLTANGSINTYQAQRMAEVKFLADVIMAEAKYEVALAALRRAQ